MVRSLAGAVALLLTSSLTVAQFPPRPEGVSTIKSKIHAGVKVSYKEPGICETTPGVKSYAGYVHLPKDALNETHEHNDYPINTFYWFFESRKDPANAPLVIWLNGGPGASALLGALSENGPCFVANDSKSTYLNPWSWNNEANLLFIDQPNQVGYSYDVLTNVTVNLDTSDLSEEENNIHPADFSDGIPEQNNTFLVGTSSSQDMRATANSTQHAATALWHFAQTWFEEFPQHKPNDERISLFTESYGGHYGPAFMDYFARRNAEIQSGKIEGHTLKLSTLGIVNGCIDAPDMVETAIEFAYNNTYSVEAISKGEYEQSMHDFHKPGGAKDLIQQCREMERTTDPHDHGNVAKTNKFCSHALDVAEGLSDGVFVKAGRGGRFDITHEATDPFPPPYMFGFLNQYETQKALGVPVNHTWASPAVAAAFYRTGDLVKGNQLEQLSYLLEHDVNVALMYGDRDFACNWLGGERYSKNIPWVHQAQFNEAGYTPLLLSSPFTESAGLTRQFGNLSFTRVYQAGHMIPSYQPEAAYEIFMRAITHRDIATGNVNLNEYASSHAEQYSTTGPSDTWWMKNDVLPQQPHQCYVLDLDGRCTEEEIAIIRNGTAVVKDWILVGSDESAAIRDHRDERTDAQFSSSQHPLLQDW